MVSRSAAQAKDIMISGKAQEALAAGIAAMRERASRPARNDPDGFEHVGSVRSGIVELYQRGKRVGPLDPAAVEEHLLRAAAAFPVAADCSPGQALQLNSATLQLSQAARTGAELDLEQARLREPGAVDGGMDWIYRDQPGVRAMHRVATDRWDGLVFPHGLVPVPPAWPVELEHVVSGFDRAAAAYRDLHESGWRRAFEHYEFMRLKSMAEVQPWFEAAVAFARVAAGPHAEKEVRRYHRSVVLRLEGPHAALKLVTPPSEWSRDGDWSSDVGWAESVLIQLVKSKDWTAARQLSEQIFERDDLLDAARRTSMVKRRLRIEKAIGSTPAAARSRPRKAGSEDRRPGRLGAVMADPRPASAQAILDAAAAGDPAAAQFLADRRSDMFQAGLLLPSAAQLTVGHLWLLHELDDSAVNGKLFLHPAADEPLRASIISQARHVAGGKAPALSRYVGKAAHEDADLLPLVLGRASDPELIVGALARHGGKADPVDVATLVLRSLDMPSARATPILDAVTRHVGDVLPSELGAAVAEAVRDAAGDPVDRASLRRSLTALAALPRRPVPTPPLADPEVEAATLVTDLERRQGGHQIDRLLARWGRPLPWRELCASVEAGRLGRDIVIRLTEREDAPPELFRAAVATPGWSAVLGYPWSLDPDLRWRWLNPLLAEPLPRDESSTKVRMELAARVLADDPRDVAERLPRDELVSVVTGIVRHQLTFDELSPHSGEAWNQAVAWWADGLVEPLPLMVEVPLQASLALHRAATGMNAEGYDALPAPVRDWLEQALMDPELGIAPALVPIVRGKAGSWRESLDNLGLRAQQLSDSPEGVSDGDFDFDFEDEDADEEGGDLPFEPELWEPEDSDSATPSASPFRSLVLYNGTSQVVDVDPSTPEGRAIVTSRRIELMHGRAAAVVRPAAEGEPELSAEEVSLILRCFGGEDSSTGGVVWFGSPAGPELGSAPDLLTEQLVEMDRARERRKRS
jgi:hypothetical protein